MATTYTGGPNGITAPSPKYVTVSTHDTNALAGGDSRGVYVGTSGDLAVVSPHGDTVIFKNLAAGVVHPIQARIIKTTDTDASDIIALY